MGTFSVRDDLTGLRFGRLTVLRYLYTDKNRSPIWECQCDCGNRTEVCRGSLKRGLTKSCGCGVREATARRSETHGGSHTRLYRTWAGMKTRCGNKASKSYPRYGGRGIAVCREWENDFHAFRDWAYSSGYSDDLTIDRINNDGDYEPSNCRWATRREQNNNSSNKHLIECNGEIHGVMEWADIVGVAYQTIIRRIARGCDVYGKQKKIMR